MDIGAFAVGVSRLCLLAVEILFVGIAFGRGIGSIIGTEAAAAFRPRTRSRSGKSGLGSLFATTSVVRDLVYENWASPDSTPFETIQPAQAPERALFWIHGTWRKSSLTAHLKLLAALKAQFPRDLIIAFNWRSRNLQSDRLTATSALYNELAKPEYSSLAILLCGHSHGGNIAASVAAALSSSRDIKAICLATPFVSFDATRKDGGSLRARQSSYSAIVLYHLWSIAAGVAAAAVLWESGIPWLPPIDGLMTQATSNLFASVTFGTAVGLLVGSIRNFGLAKQIGLAQEQASELHKRTEGAFRLVVLRADDDPLLDTMLSTVAAHDSTSVAAVVNQRKTDSVYGSAGVVLLDFVIKVAAMLAYVSVIRQVYSALAFATVPHVESDTMTVAILIAIAVLLVVPACVLIWLYPARLFVMMGGYIGRLVIALSPGRLLLTIAQARAAGLPIGALYAGAVRISDAPRGMIAERVPTNGLLSELSVFRRHTGMLMSPEVIQRVIGECTANEFKAPQSEAGELTGQSRT